MKLLILEDSLTFQRAWRRWLSKYGVEHVFVQSVDELHQVFDSTFDGFFLDHEVFGAANGRDAAWWLVEQGVAPERICCISSVRRKDYPPESKFYRKPNFKAAVWFMYEGEAPEGMCPW